MNDDFFDWLDNCPVEWALLEDDEDGRSYFFKDNTEEREK